MLDFEFYNPTHIVFGKNVIRRLDDLLVADARILLLYGGGSIKSNGVYAMIKKALKKRTTVEFGGVLPNPEYSQLMEAIKIARAEGIDFILAAGGGSVIDGAKFIAAALHYNGKDPWDIVEKAHPIETATPLGCVLTLPATGSEMNSIGVISRADRTMKQSFRANALYPQFALLDPATTVSLPRRQTVNGAIDTIAHTLEQYLTYPTGAALTDRFAESIVRTVIETTPVVLDKPDNVGARGTLMWCATNALNGLLRCGQVSDFASHRIGHEITAQYGIDHAITLAIVLPAMMRCRLSQKKKKLAQFAERVFDVSSDSVNEKAVIAADRLELLFKSWGAPTRLTDCGLDASVIKRVSTAIGRRGVLLGERGDIGKTDIAEILTAAL